MRAWTGPRRSHWTGRTSWASPGGRPVLPGQNRSLAPRTETHTAVARRAAAELGIADLLIDRPRTTAELADATKSHPDMLYRLLRFLASAGIFEEADGAWRLTPLAELLRSDGAASVRAGARMFGRLTPAIACLSDNIRSGTCAYSLAFGKPIFEDLVSKPEEAAIFDAAMKSFHGGETDAVLDAYDYSGVSVLADIGCGSGEVMAATLRRYPTIRGLLFDQGHVMARTEQNIRNAGVADRCDMRTGSFFEGVPSGADTYTMRHIIHDWQDDRCLTILGHIRQVIPADGRLLIIETVVPDGNGSSPSKLFDIIMMVVPDGLERTAAQFRVLLSAAGFAMTGITPTASPVSVIEARPI